MSLYGEIQGVGLTVSLCLTLFLTAYGIHQSQQRGYESHLIAFLAHMGVLSGVILSELLLMGASPELNLIGFTVIFHIGNWLAGATFVWFVGMYAHTTHWSTRWMVGITVGVPIVLILGGIIGAVFLSTPPGGFTYESIASSGVSREYQSLDGALRASVWFIRVAGHALFLLGIGMLTHLILRDQSHLFSRQSMAVAIGASAPLLTTGLSMSEIVSTDLGLAGIGYGATAVGFAIATFRYRLLAVTPIERHRLLTELTDPVIMLDHKSRVVDCNPAAIELVDAPQEWCGKPAAAFFSSLPSTVRRGLLGESPQTEISIEESESTRWFSVECRTVRARRPPEDQLIVLREITSEKQRHIELEQNNERLKQFAGTIAHDMQNPLTVAQAHLNLIRDQDHTEHLEAIETAHDRLEQQIDDVLTLAHGDDIIAADTTVQLADVAAAATDHIDFTDCDCEILIPPSITVRGDADQLLRVFENLYQNASTHNDTPVTVRVGLVGETETQRSDHPQGFYIEDTGEGIPEEIRTAVLEGGYTTHTDGTGFGLSIVHTIVDAHGWEITITESADGGARFEITGVDIR